MSVRLGYLLDLRAGNALKAIDANPLTFTVNNYRLRISAFAPNAASGSFALEVTHGISGVAALDGTPATAYTTAAGFNANSTLYDALANIVGVTANDSAGQSVTVTDAGFDAIGPFVDVLVTANSAPTGPALVIKSGGAATLTAALDTTAITGFSGRALTTVVQGGPIRATSTYDRNGTLLGMDLESHILAAADLGPATAVGGTVDPAAAQRVPQRLLRVNATELLIIRGANGGFAFGHGGDVTPATMVP